ncbi:hypothetical protein RCC89_15850 [Cytophagaceae bacterium ABcell3]|nr:hypothetical protein RCC89_15850 [Cytophagaceae bacterium ABcell3]
MLPYFLVFTLITYVIFNVYVDSRIVKANYFNEKRRKVHRVFIWALPFIGALLIRNFWKNKQKGMEIMTKEKRKDSPSQTNIGGDNISDSGDS